MGPDEAIRVLEATLVVEEGLLYLGAPTHEEWQAMHEVPREELAPTWVCRVVDVYGGSTWGAVADELLRVAEEPGRKTSTEPLLRDPPTETGILVYFPPRYPDAARLFEVVADAIGPLLMGVSFRATYGHLAEVATEALVSTGCPLVALIDDDPDSYLRAVETGQVRVYLIDPDKWETDRHAFRSVRRT